MVCQPRFQLPHGPDGPLVVPGDVPHRGDSRQAVRDAMRDLLYIPFRFENDGSRVIYRVPDDGAETSELAQ